ncbi:hypothetical protein [Actinoplanes siamensis]|uniref:Uncharacterized protein n=1 Tax=Actinoplanes siamensis TaxID=1223317 RepID=A0A919TJQ2_9ACTN|nr:hypothetical protein [Actinoplanes siamensis]GIF05316.1 hypothetical protein Asi03nite_28540 [Actinoplanes siamensis]
MDRLDDLLAATEPLLSRVDQVFSAAGAPQAHGVWSELRRVRLLPGDAVRAVAALRPAALADAAPQLRAQAQACVDTADALPPAGAWTGEAAEAYESARRRTAEQLTAGPDSLSRRMTATADLADALTDWMAHTRNVLAAALGEVLTSAEALTVLTGGGFPEPSETEAAAGIAAHLLQAIADAYDRAETLLDDARSLRST